MEIIHACTISFGLILKINFATTKVEVVQGQNDQVVSLSLGST